MNIAALLSRKGFLSEYGRQVHDMYDRGEIHPTIGNVEHPLSSPVGEETLSSHQQVWDRIHTTPNSMMPIFVPSIHRWSMDRGTLRWISDMRLQDYTTVFVRENELDDYESAWPEFRFVVVPRDVDCVGRTRNYLLDYAVENDIDMYLECDDDIVDMSYMYSDVNRSGGLCSRHSAIGIASRMDPDFKRVTLNYALWCARDAFSNVDDMMMFGWKTQHMSMGPRLAMSRWGVNSIVTPRRLCVWNAKRMHENGIRVPDDFMYHGDDIGIVASILEHGFSVGASSACVYEFISEKNGSTLRDVNDPEEERRIHQLEYEHLSKMDIVRRGYLRFTTPYEDGSYRYGDVSWQNYSKITGRRRIEMFHDGTSREY